MEYVFAVVPDRLTFVRGDVPGRLALSLLSSPRQACFVVSSVYGGPQIILLFQLIYASQFINMWVAVRMNIGMFKFPRD